MIYMSVPDIAHSNTAPPLLFNSLTSLALFVPSAIFSFGLPCVALKEGESGEVSFFHDAVVIPFSEMCNMSTYSAVKGLSFV